MVKGTLYFLYSSAAKLAKTYGYVDRLRRLFEEYKALIAMKITQSRDEKESFHFKFVSL